MCITIEYQILKNSRGKYARKGTENKGKNQEGDGFHNRIVHKV